MGISLGAGPADRRPRQIIWRSGGQDKSRQLLTDVAPASVGQHPDSWLAVGTWKRISIRKG